MRFSKAGSETRLVSIQCATESVGESDAEYDMTVSSVSKCGESGSAYTVTVLNTSSRLQHCNSKSPKGDCRMSPGLRWFLDSLADLYPE
jgi:hypothetical protein